MLHGVHGTRRDGMPQFYVARAMLYTISYIHEARSPVNAVYQKVLFEAKTKQQ